MATTKKVTGSRGRDLANRLLDALAEVASDPLPGARQLPVLNGVSPKGLTACPLENILASAIGLLAESRRIFTYGNSVVIEVDSQDGADRSLVNLRTGTQVDSGAAHWLANLFICDWGGKQFGPPHELVQVLLRAAPLMTRVPRIQLHARRPVFDADFILRGPGWHSTAGILVHGPEVEPVLAEPQCSSLPILDRLPLHVRTLLSGFCFAGPADLANTLAILLTGLLINHFLVQPRPLALVDGNQPSVGKTLLGRVIEVILGGSDTRVIHYTENEEELQKRICAHARDGSRAVLLFDNARTKGGGPVESVVIEANCMAPEICLRLLGRSVNFIRPNDLLWMLTMNCTRVNPDLLSRALPIRLFYDGDPTQRAFALPDPIGYAREHRLALLGELAGMVIRWNQHGRPEGGRNHRCSYWAKIIGGILETAGLPEVLSNLGDAATAFDDALDETTALAEAAVVAGGFFVNECDHNEEDQE
jgi:hypothetical protein